MDPELFLEPVSSDYRCPICRYVLDPEKSVETPCCQHGFCRDCFQALLARNMDCPMCRQPISSGSLRPLHRLVKNSILALRMRCHQRDQGCDATFTFGALEMHRRTECKAQHVFCDASGCVFSKDAALDWGPHHSRAFKSVLMGTVENDGAALLALGYVKEFEPQFAPLLTETATLALRDLPDAPVLYRAAAETGLAEAWFRLAITCSWAADAAAETGGGAGAGAGTEAGTGPRTGAPSSPEGETKAEDSRSRASAASAGGRAAAAPDAAVLDDDDAEEVAADERSLAGVLARQLEGRAGTGEGANVLRLGREAGSTSCLVLSAALVLDGGRGASASPMTAVEMLSVAAAAGHVQAALALGMVHWKGTHGVATDLQAGIKWLRVAAERGCAEAMYRIAGAYMVGQSVPHDTVVGARWFRRAAEAGHAQGQLQYGMCCSRGKGVEKDYTEALRWYRLAAEQNVPQACTNVAVFLELGRGTEVDMEEAFAWYKRGADLGHGLGQRYLGDCFAKGIGTEVDMAEAQVWYERAAAAGNCEAAVSLASCVAASPSPPSPALLGRVLRMLHASSSRAHALRMLGIYYATGGLSLAPGHCGVGKALESAAELPGWRGPPSSAPRLSDAIGHMVRAQTDDEQAIFPLARLLLYALRRHERGGGDCPMSNSVSPEEREWSLVSPASSAYVFDSLVDLLGAEQQGDGASAESNASLGRGASTHLFSSHRMAMAADHCARCGVCPHDAAEQVWRLSQDLMVRGDAEGRCLYAECLLRGCGVAQDPAQALVTLLSMTQSPVGAPAMGVLAFLHAVGLRVVQSHRLAVAWATEGALRPEPDTRCLRVVMAMAGVRGALSDAAQAAVRRGLDSAIEQLAKEAVQRVIKGETMPSSLRLLCAELEPVRSLPSGGAVPRLEGGGSGSGSGSGLVATPRRARKRTRRTVKESGDAEDASAGKEKSAPKRRRRRE